ALTRTGDVLGTLAYMAPEQSEGQAVGEEADLYALALVLYEALCGVNPVRGATPAATARRIGRPLESLARRRGDLPRALIDALDGALAPAPEDRGSIEHLRLALEDVLEQGLATARRAGGARRACPAPGPAARCVDRVRDRGRGLAVLDRALRRGAARPRCAGAAARAPGRAPLHARGGRMARVRAGADPRPRRPRRRLPRSCRPGLALARACGPRRARLLVAAPRRAAAGAAPVARVARRRARTRRLGGLDRDHGLPRDRPGPQPRNAVRGAAGGVRRRGAAVARAWPQRPARRDRRGGLVGRPRRRHAAAGQRARRPRGPPGSPRARARGDPRRRARGRGPGSARPRLT